MASYLHFNGQLIDSQEKLVTADNRGLRYGDGLFETIKIINDRVLLAPLHFERLFNGLSRLQFELPAFLTPAWLTEAILSLCRKNNHQQAARVRINLFRGNGGLYDPENLSPQVVIQSEPLAEHYQQWNGQGLRIDIYPDAQKSCDAFSNLKCNNYLPYVMAALQARRQNLDDCLVLNTHQRICDASIANVWWIKDGAIFTPPLSEGCVAGVMRQYLLQTAAQQTSLAAVIEKPLTAADLENADEVFLTNALAGIRWVRTFRHKDFTCDLTKRLYDLCIPEMIQ